MNKKITEEAWYLMYCDYPDLHWARLRVYDDETAEVFDLDGETWKFEDVEDAKIWLCDDEYTPFNSLDEEDEEELGVPLSSIEIPSGESDAELLKKMYVECSSS